MGNGNDLHYYSICNLFMALRPRHTFTGACFASAGGPPGQVVVEVLALFTVEALSVVGALTATVDLPHTVTRHQYCYTRTVTLLHTVTRH